ncbi:DUF6611 family protein [uncultured Amnibacterium sp.]|uniref:DUF6611 family protein n=1 Tax=uncultured Amnibacterium sp. TaxID=1631851 RepID=UPI0035CADF6C
MVDRLLHGDRAWGGLDVWPSRGGVVRYRLTVYPPGTNARERMLHRMWRAWPLTGGIVWLAIMLVVGSFASAPQALWAATGTIGVATAVTAWLTRGRPRPRTLTALLVDDIGGRLTAGWFVELRNAFEELEATELRLRAGRISAVQFEVRWSEVFAGLDLPRVPSDGARARYGATRSGRTGLRHPEP